MDKAKQLTKIEVGHFCLERLGVDSGIRFRFINDVPM